MAEALSRKDQYAQQKEIRLEDLKRCLKSDGSWEERFRICNEICDGYLLYLFDSVYRYSVELCRLADYLYTHETITGQEFMDLLNEPAS